MDTILNFDCSAPRASMSAFSRRMRWTWIAVLALCMPVWTMAAEVPVQSAPDRRVADQVLVRALRDHHWTLLSATDAAGQPLAAVMDLGYAFVIKFDGARLAILGGCNQMSGNWRVSPRGRLTVGRLAATMKACEPPLMQADTALGALLARPLEVKVTLGTTPRLHLSTPAKMSLVLRGQPTLRSLYGLPMRIYLEVAPQAVACQPADSAPTQCLQVRERRFDKQGLRIDPPGQWRAFDDRIDGYAHTPGVRTVLRIDRYERGQTPAGTSAYVYVLDIVVESEFVAK